MIPHSRPTITRQHLESALGRMITDKLATGDLIEQFEKDFAAIFGRAYSAVFVSSGSAALEMIFSYIELSEGDEVIMPSFYNSSPLQAVNRFKARPVFIDIDEDSYNMDMDLVLEKVNDKTKAVLVPHMFGTPAMIDELADVKAYIIEDCGHALGSSFQERPVGTFSDFAYFSLAATRIITSGGAGGMILSKKKGVAGKFKDMRYYDKKDDLLPRYNFFPTDIQAAYGLAELKHLNKAVKLRREIADNYTNALMEAEASRFELPENSEPNHYRYVIKLEGEMGVKQCMEMFEKQGIETARAVYKPLHLYYNDIDSEEFTHTEQAYMLSLSLPIYPMLQPKDEELICKLIKRIR